MEIDEYKLINDVLSKTYEDFDKGGIKGLAPILSNVQETFSLEDIAANLVLLHPWIIEKGTKT